LRGPVAHRCRHGGLIAPATRGRTTRAAAIQRGRCRVCGGRGGPHQAGSHGPLPDSR
jgi:hypothetical protein